MHLVQTLQQSPGRQTLMDFHLQKHSGELLLLLDLLMHDPKTNSINLLIRIYSPHCNNLPYQDHILLKHSVKHSN